MEDIKFSCQHYPDMFTTLNEGRFIKPTKEGKILWYMRNCTPDLEESLVAAIIQDALDVWGKEMFPITFERSLKEKDAEIRITFSSNSQLDNTSFPDPFRPPFPFNEGVLAYAFPPADHSLSSDMWFNEDINWGEIHCDEKKLTDLKTVIIHEVGHALNIGHSEDREAIMYPTYSGEMRVLGKDDLLAIEHIYGGIIAKLKEDLGIVDEASSNPETAAFKKMLKAELVQEIVSRDKVIAQLKFENSNFKDILKAIDEFFGDLIRQKDNILALLNILLAGKLKILLNLGDIKNLSLAIWKELKEKSTASLPNKLRKYLNA